MAGTSRLKVGVDVPWVTSWSEEPMGGVARCPSVGGRLAVHQIERPGVGKPLYSMNHCRRQRLSVARMLCPMCGLPTAPGDRWMLTARRVTAGALRSRRLGHLLPAAFRDDRALVDAGSIAPMHLACATAARERCPHLATDPAVELTAFPDSWLVQPLLVQAQAPGGGRATSSTAASGFPLIVFLQLYGLEPEQASAGTDRPSASPPAPPQGHD